MKPKIIYQELTQGSAFAIDQHGEFTISNTGYILTGNNLEYLLKMLNSNIIEFVYRNFYGTTIGQTGVRWLAQHIENLPIPIPIKSTNSPVMDTEEKICELYGLNPVEIEFIQSQYNQ